MGKQVGLTQPGKELCQRIVPVLHQLEEIRVVMQENRRLRRFTSG